MMHILHHLVFYFSQCFSFEIMYIRLATMYKNRENLKKEPPLQILGNIPLFGIFLTKNLFLLVAHFVVTQENSESLKTTIYSIFIELYSIHSEDLNYQIYSKILIYNIPHSCHFPIVIPCFIVPYCTKTRHIHHNVNCTHMLLHSPSRSHMYMEHAAKMKEVD